ncbi:MAG: hypothetical protein LLF92_07585 [Planctomycetaceae bacterium]|nr:hypothetical protein [Planctomycetaceae bacterium]
MEKNLEHTAEKRPSKKVFLWQILLVLTGILLLFLIHWFVGLFRVPAYFRTVEIIESNQISLYLSNVILPELYNKSQTGKPFEVIFTEEGINEIISRHIDAKSLKKWDFSDISVTFSTGKILLTGKTKYRGHDFIVTAVFKPAICEKGFNAGLTQIRAGTSSLPFASHFIRDKILYKLAGQNSDVVQYAGVLFSDNKIPPEFTFEHRNIKVQEIIIDNHKLTIRFLPD